MRLHVLPYRFQDLFNRHYFQEHFSAIFKEKKFPFPGILGRRDLAFDDFGEDAIAHNIKPRIINEKIKITAPVMAAAFTDLAVLLPLVC